MSLEIQSNFSYCENFDYLNDNYIATTFASIGVILNALCLFVFTKIILKSKSDVRIFIYLLFKTLFDILTLMHRCINPIFNCKTCYWYTYYITNLFSIIMGDYLKFVFPFCSILCELFSVLERYLCINSNSKISLIKKVPSKFFIIFVFAFGSAFYVYRLFEKDIISKETKIDKKGNNTSGPKEIKYKLVDSAFSSTDLDFAFRMIHTIFRDIICVFALLLLNILLLRKFKTIIKNKKKLGNKVNAKAEASEKNITIMIMIISVLSIVGHIPTFLKYMPYFNENKCIKSMVVLFTIISISFNFFVYFKFNVVFKNFFFSFFFIRAKNSDTNNSHSKFLSKSLKTTTI